MYIYIERERDKITSLNLILIKIIFIINYMLLIIIYLNFFTIKFFITIISNNQKLKLHVCIYIVVYTFFFFKLIIICFYLTKICFLYKVIIIHIF